MPRDIRSAAVPHEPKEHATLMAHAHHEKVDRGSLTDAHIDIHAMYADGLHEDWEKIVDQPLHVAWMHWPMMPTNSVRPS